MRVAILGCGAVTVRNHLPAILSRQDAAVRLLVDIDTDRARALAASYDIPHAADDYSALIDEFDGAIVALPNHLHASVGCDLLRHGKHVLMEKPMALTSGECDALIEASSEGKALLAIGLWRRQLSAGRLARAIIQSGMLGALRSFDIEDGDVYGWPVASDFPFRRDKAGGGVLMDMGPHVLDQVRWWLGPCEVVAYEDDAFGGVEADCRVTLRTAGGIEGVVVLSRLRTLRNSAIMRAENGELEVSLTENRLAVRVLEPERLVAGAATLRYSPPPQSVVDLFEAQLADWLAAVRGEATTIAGGYDGWNAVVLIEQCYARRVAVLQPWQGASRAHAAE